MPFWYELGQHGGARPAPEQEDEAAHLARAADEVLCVELALARRGARRHQRQVHAPVPRARPVGAAAAAATWHQRSDARLAGSRATGNADLPACSKPHMGRSLVFKLSPIRVRVAFP
jgi:hypothetical protein